MDITAIEGRELTSVEFAAESMKLRFGDSSGSAGPTFTLYAWPHLLFEAFSIAYGEPEYRNGLCAQIGEEVAKASLNEDDALTIELENHTVIALSLREEDREGPVAGSYSEDGFGRDEEEF